MQSNKIKNIHANENGSRIASKSCTRTKGKLLEISKPARASVKKALLNQLDMIR